MNERTIFMEALERGSPGDRAAYLDAACAGDPGLRARVGALLRSHDSAGEFLDKPVPERLAEVTPPDDTRTGPAGPEGNEPTTARSQPGPPAGATIAGRYRLIEQIGEGGMGTVWLAQQTEPVKRLVAVKLIKPGMDSRQVVARFEAERQALALMDHPNIAKVHDAGTAPDGRPFFAMELVKGVPITKFCDENRLTPRQRLELFMPVCQAVQHAHQKGVIHRDLKPSNVLVAPYDDKPVVKVIDFGVARATGQPLTDGSLHTGFGAVVGTPEYMSPEQAELNNQDIDTRSDVYSLGVLLYELLTGTTPLERNRVNQSGLLEALRVIREEEVPTLSNRLGTTAELPAIAANRSLDPARLTRLVRGELDWVVMKCLEKDRARRYETANGLAADVQRYLADEPVSACRPSAAYRFRKFARRNKAALGAASIVALALLSAVGALGVAVRTLVVSNASTGAALAREQRARGDLAAVLEREQQTLYLQRIASAASEVPGGNLGLAERLLDECPVARRGWEWHLLKRRRYEEPRDLPHPVAVLRVAYSPDGRYLASGCLDGTVTVWDRRTVRPLHTWKGGPDAHRAHVYGLAFSPNSRRLATGGNDGLILVWDLNAGALRQRLDGHTQAITQLAFRPDGRQLASAGEDGTVRLWDLTGAQPERTLSGHPGAVRGLAFSVDGQLISAGADGEVRLWDPDTGTAAASFRGATRWVSALAFHPASRRLALGSRDGNVELWDDLSAGEPRILRGHTAEITSLAFSPDGRRLVSAGDDKLLKVWDAATGQEAITFDIDRTPIGVAFSPDGHELACGYSRPEPVLRLWNGAPLSGKEGIDRALILTGHDEPVVRVAFSPDGRRLASAGRDGTARVYDAVTGRETLTFRGHDALVCAVAFSPDGKRVASGSWDERVLVWDAVTGQVLQTLSGGAGFVFDVAFSPDGRTLGSAHANGTVLLWDPATGHLLRPPVRAHDTEVAGIAFSPDGKLFATAGGRDHAAKVWTLATGEVRTALPGVISRVWGVAFSPDGQSVAAAQGGYLTVWDAASGTEVRSFHTGSTRVSHLAFSPDSRRLASAGWDQTVRLWDAGTGRQVALLRGQAGPVQGVAFSPDGRRLASCGGYRGKGEIKIWDAASWATSQSDSRER